ncbi:hypothetical protein NDU88_011803 [Pleurodeles waltl]|uniref:Uncharacterized protein n=1 Tax=Pleurodeles waltl TaxID=8319 RepID=A0AAV7PZI9_PLEWA|nr:hypothetical protein NDU88_011803 [Pleurodeles waltl]
MMLAGQLSEGGHVDVEQRGAEGGSLGDAADEDGIVFEEVGELSVDDLLDDFRWKREERDRTEVFEVVGVSPGFFEEGLDFCVFPAVREGGRSEGEVDDLAEFGGDGGVG